MKAIMISIKPRWCAKIMNGDKTIEVRTSKALANAIQKLIDEQGYADFYGYCCKTNYLGFISNKYIGKVNFKFRCYKVEKITPQIWSPIKEKEVLNSACLDKYELFDYVCSHDGTEDKPFYAIHISDLEIFDEPKELWRFSNCDKYPYTKYISKAPQSWCYVEVEEYEDL